MRVPSPLSFAQEGLWLTQQQKGIGSALTLAFADRISKDLKVDALENACGQLLKAHPCLSSLVRVENGQLQSQAVDAPEPLVYIEGDSSSAKIKQRLEQDWDLANDLPSRFHLFREPDESYIFLCAFHHMIMDAFSLFHVRETLRHHYAKEVGMEDDALEAHVWIPRREASRRLKLNYWRRQLHGFEGVAQWPADRPRQPAGTGRCHRVVGSMSMDHRKRLRDLSRRHGVTEQTIFLSAYRGTLSHWVEQQDLAVGVPFAGRDQEDLSRAIGYLARLLPLRIAIEGDPTFEDLVAQVDRGMREAMRFQEVSYPELLTALQVPRQDGVTPLFQSVFRLLYPKHKGLLSPHLQSEPIDIEESHTAWEMDWSAILGPQSLELRPLAQEDRFNPSTCHRLMGQFVTFLEQALEDPSKPLSQIPISDSQDRLRVESWGRGPEPVVPEGNLWDRFSHQCLQRGDHIAITVEGREITYSALSLRAEGFAQALLHRGVACGDKVGLHLLRGPAFIHALLACLRIGAIATPLEVHHPLQHKTQILRDAQIKLVLSPTPFPGWASISPRELANHQGPSLPWPKVSSSHPALLFFTSASTGSPKGVLIPHRALLARFGTPSDLHLGDRTRTLLASSLAFDASSFEIWAALLNGGSIAIYNSPKPALRELGNRIQQDQVNTLWLTASFFNLIVDRCPEILHQVEILVAGGEALSSQHCRSILKLFPNLRLINGYGPTEATTFACTNTLSKQISPSVPIGRPMAHTQAMVIRDNGQEAAIGVEGELVLGGPGLALGYLDTDHCGGFITTRDGQRLYRTGDRVRWLETGLLEFLGRRDEQVKIRGFRVELEEVNTALRSHPSIQDAAAFIKVRPDGSRTLAAALCSERAHHLNLKRFRRSLGEVLPDHAIPTEFFAVPKIPNTPNGKVNHRALQKLEHPAHTPEKDGEHHPLVQELLEMWRELTDRSDLLPDDHLFEFGADSLMAMTMVDHLEKRFGLRLPVTLIQDHPTIRELSDALNQWKDADPGFVQTWAGGDQLPLFFLHRDLQGGGLYCGNLAKSMVGQRPMHAIRP